MRRPVVTRDGLRWLGLAPLAGATFLFVLPVLWMVTTSFVNSGRLVPDTGEAIPIRHVNEAMANLKSGRYLTRSVLRLPFGD